VHRVLAGREHIDGNVGMEVGGSQISTTSTSVSAIDSSGDSYAAKSARSIDSLSCPKLSRVSVKSRAVVRAAIAERDDPGDEVYFGRKGRAPCP
jgi:hypothetical protein